MKTEKSLMQISVTVKYFTVTLLLVLIALNSTTFAQRSLSPDGGKYVYYHQTGENTDIFTIDLKGVQNVD